MSRKKVLIAASIAGVILIATLTIFLLFIRQQEHKKFSPMVAPNIAKLNTGIAKAENYYQGLYKTMGNSGAVVTEYYSGKTSVYTVRHATVGAIYYYSYIHNATKSAQLREFVGKYGFNIKDDIQSFIWTHNTSAPKDIVYSTSEYHDCFIKLPAIGNVFPYHSKVCKLGLPGVLLYTIATRFDTFLPIVNDLQELEEHKPLTTSITSLENKYNDLGFGMPLCTPLACSNVASTLRTAQFGELELRLGNMKYADAAASELLKAENKEGAIYLSYDKNGKLSNKKPLVYSLLDKLLNDTPVYHGYIPTNAETMNNSLAFLLDYRCVKYKICS